MPNRCCGCVHMVGNEGLQRRQGHGACRYAARVEQRGGGSSTKKRSTLLFCVCMWKVIGSQTCPK